MALPDPHPSAAEIWKGRFWKSVKIFFVLLLHMVLFFKGLMRDRYVGLALAPLVCFAVWQWICKIAVGEGFSPALTIRVSDAKTLRNVLFTVFFTLNLVFFLYHLWSWYAVGSGAGP